MMKKTVFSMLCAVMLCVTGADGEVYTYDSLHRLTKADYSGGAYIEYAYDDAGNMTRKSVYETALMVKLAEFSAEMSDVCVVLKWKTHSEIDNAGFHILRSEYEDGEYERITDTLIAAQGEATQGASYSYTDRDVIPGRTYYYRLEDTDFRGAVNLSPPVSPVRTADVIRILQINAGIPLSPPDDAVTDGKAGIDDAVRLLRAVPGIKGR